MCNCVITYMWLLLFQDVKIVLPFFPLSLFLSYNQHTSFIFSSHHCSQLVNIWFSKLKYECSCCFVVVKFCNLKLNFILYFVNIYKVNLIVNIYRHYSLFLQFQAVVVPSVFVCFFCVHLFCIFLDYFLVFLRFLNRNLNGWFICFSATPQIY